MAIDIGSEAIDRNTYTGSGKTTIDRNNPANASGTITGVEIFAYTTYDLENCVVGTFYTTNGNTLKCRDSEAIGTVTAGSKQTFPVTLTVEAGDYIGIYFTAGYLERSDSGFGGMWFVTGEYIDPGDEATYTLWSGDAISLYGTGVEAGVTHELAGVISGVASVSGAITKVTLYEYYNTGDNTASTAYSNYWTGQTFTPAIAHKNTSVKLKLYKVGSPGTITASIRATDGEGHPTGEDLCSGTTDGNTLTEDTSGEWREITLGDGYNLNADTKYAIVVRALDGTSSHFLRWRLDSTDPTYAGGASEYSDNSGVDWSTTLTYDKMFEEWGEALGVTYYLAGVIVGVASVAGIALITRGLAGLASGVCGVSGLAIVTYKLAGIAQGIASTSGSLIVVTTHYLTGIAQGAASVSGFTAITRTLAGVSSGVASATASLINIKWLIGLTEGACSVIGSLPVTKTIAGVVAGVCSVTGSLLFVKWLSGLTAGVATVTGNLFHVRKALRVLKALRNIPPVDWNTPER